MVKALSEVVLPALDPGDKVALEQGLYATFMPKPYAGDNGSGMHVHQSVWKDGKNLFAGDQYAGLSEFALYYIGGIIKHARALNAITNPCTNSYKRLIPGFEAPVLRAYSARNRSGCVRIPWTESPKAKRVEARFPDPSANPYLAFAALLMAGLDGIKNKIEPPQPVDEEDLKPAPDLMAALRKTLEENRRKKSGSGKSGGKKKSGATRKKSRKG